MHSSLIHIWLHVFVSVSLFLLVISPQNSLKLSNLFLFLTWKILAPYGVLQAFSRLSLPVLANHLPQ